MTSHDIHKSTCDKCGMSFRISCPTTAASRGVCAEAGCERPFWHGRRDAAGPVFCGMTPEDYDEWQRTRCAA